MSKAIMVDIETLASVSSAAITQIAAVLFDLDTGAIETDTHNVYVRRGFGTVNRDTALWWMQQPSAQAFAKRVETEGVDLREALMRFTGWVIAARGGQKIPLYAHGAPFDFPVLRASFEACEFAPPWSYRDELCTRQLYRELGRVPSVPEPEGYVKHDALSDCRMQVAQLVAARRALGLVRVAA